ncbi:multidrug effflux MFS transporter [Neorhizobium sp. JUb45]|uniref:multidrug effflux MFS transporter n=1 Tax=unclassified Neorhizobium TaxID=2629175 RepID=UPI00104EAEB3|nr:multidrug effflux MFS transporter [Neorhizobium sp. JUb45]TCR01225.1 DHA1 family purine ribonucleoside efflux pump-like MFS transporter/DHA1 family bicyclomycin/chloramphenicol resistance-like MFS transporter [Neorhizobium sp. JUb45]
MTSSVVPPEKKRMSERRVAIFGAVLTAIGPISMAISTPAMPEMVKAFGTTEAAIKLSLSLYFGGFAMAQLLAGPASDAFGRRKTTIAFMAIYLLGALISVFATSVEALLIGRLIQGIGASVGVTVARAIVRDLFIGAEAARIMNLVGIMVAIGPAMGPTIGGLALSAFGWESVFILMVLFGVGIVASVFFLLKETTVPDRTRIRPARLISAYRETLSEPRFLTTALILGGSVGALYAQSTMLPFVLIGAVGLTPTQFGLSMLMQSGAYFTGSLVLKRVSSRIGGPGAVRIGLALIGFGALLMFSWNMLLPATLVSIMGPVAICTFGLSFITPQVVTMALAPFPHIAGSASAIMGFIQMGFGFTGGLAAAALGSPVLAFSIIIPAMELIAIASYFGYLALNRRR